MEHKIFLDLAIIIFLSKVLGAISHKFRQPPVIGMLFLGVILGPTVLGFIAPDEIILWIGKVGVLFLLFEAGIETDLKQIKKDLVIIRKNLKMLFNLIFLINRQLKMKR